MRRWLIRQGVPPEKVLADFAGRRTYDSLKRAQGVFGIQRLVVVSSDFHMARCIYLAQGLGLDSYGIASQTGQHTLAKQSAFWFREYGARHLAAMDLLFPPNVKLGPREATPDDPAPLAQSPVQAPVQPLP